MTGKADLRIWGEKLTALVKKNRFLLLVVLAGLILLTIPTGRGEGGNTGESQAAAEIAGEDLGALAMEEKLSRALSRIDGAGEVTVVLSVKSGVRQVLAQDGRQTEAERTASTVVISQGSGSQTAVVLQQVSPEYLGALIICPGGNDPTVRLRITEATAALTGLGADKITVCKAK